VNVAESIEQRFGLGAIDQISFAVADVDEAVPRYTAMFGGPFDLLDVPKLRVECHGQPSTTTLRLGLGRSGGLEVELVQVVSGDWPTLDLLTSRGEGLHHVRYPVADIATSRAEMEAAGCRVTMRGEAGGVSFTYLECPLLNGMTIELIQMPEE
jgi:catechol 2,3-dioxygenase-like lactoylglutathione lyase family enzyme